MSVFKTESQCCMWKLCSDQTADLIEKQRSESDFQIVSLKTTL